MSMVLDCAGYQAPYRDSDSFTLPTILDADPRPTLVVDTSIYRHADEATIVYTNPALQRRNSLVSSLKRELKPTSDFYVWAHSLHTQEHYYRFGGTLWFGFCVQARWRVIGAVSLLPQVEYESETTPTFQQSSSPVLSFDKHASYEVALSQLKEEIRMREVSRKQSIKERQSCWEVVQQLREEIKELEAVTSRTKPSKLDSRKSLSAVSMSRSLSSSDAIFPTLQSTNMMTNSKRARQESQDPIHRGFSPPQSLARQALPVRMDGHTETSMALEKFQRLAEAVDVGFFDYDTDGKLLHANNAWYALSGHPRDPELHTTLSFAQCVYPDDTELVMNQWNTLLKGQSVTFEMRWRKPAPPSAGPNAPYGFQWVLSACVPVIGEDGEVKSISGCTTDINAQKQRAQVAWQRAEALERARASEERFARFAEVAPIAIFRFDKHRNVEYCNDRWFEMTGVPKQRFEDIVWPVSVHEDDVELCLKAWDKASIDRSIGQIEFRLRKDWHDMHGRRGKAWVYCTFFAEFTEDGSFNGLMGSLLDISHLKWSENMAKLRADEALEAKKQQENFIDITSHEMRNPLSAMVQCADSVVTSLNDISKVLENTIGYRSSENSIMLKESIDTGMDAVQTILSCAAHQKRIVDDVLTLSKLDSNLLIITPVKTDPLDMVHTVLKMFEMDSNKADVELIRELSPSFHDLGIQWLMLDPSRLSQILINLLGNAIKFTRTENTRKVAVRMSASLEPPSAFDRHIDYIPAESAMDDLGDYMECNDNDLVYLKFEVQDTGRGLNLEEKEKLFMRFSQASPKTHVQYGGSGLGLFISRKLTEMQGGEIGFASEPDVGSTFAFYVRTRRTAPPVMELESAPELPETRKLNAFEKKAPRALRVLLVEDNLVNQKVLSKQLERQDCTVYVAGHGLEALDFLKSTNMWVRAETDARSSSAPKPIDIDVILMDIEMPIMGGLECTRRIRQLEQAGKLNRSLRIISISANARQEQVNEAKAAGANDTITKPFRIKELMPKLYKLTGLS